MSKKIVLISLIIFSSFTLIKCVSKQNEQSLEDNISQKSFNTQLKKMVHDFYYLKKSDTLDFSNIQSGKWDSVYIFSEYTRRNSLEKGWGWVNWDLVTKKGGMVPPENIRFVFVNKSTAINYIDVNTELINEIHYSKYFKNEIGNLVSNRSALIEPHFSPWNCFSKEKAKFILVRPTHVRVENKDSLLFVMPNSFFKGVQNLDKGSSNHSLNMHPLSGCGYPNCLGNRLNKK